MISITILTPTMFFAIPTLILTILAKNFFLRY